MHVSTNENMKKEQSDNALYNPKKRCVLKGGNKSPIQVVNVLLHSFLFNQMCFSFLYHLQKLLFSVAEMMCLICKVAVRCLPSGGQLWRVL